MFLAPLPDEPSLLTLMADHHIAPVMARDGHPTQHLPPRGERVAVHPRPVGRDFAAEIFVRAFNAILFFSHLASLLSAAQDTTPAPPGR